MQKKILSGLILSSVLCVDAMAIAPGFYMGLMMGPASNGGTEQAVQVLPLPAAPCTLPPPAVCVPATTTTPPNVGLATPKSTQFGSRLFFGYKFNQYAGFEGGFTYFSGISYSVNQNIATATPGSSIPLTAAAGTTARVRAVDFVGKLDYSYNNTIGFFGKGGVVAVYTTTPGALQPTAGHWVAAGTKSNPGGVKLVTSGSNKYSTKLSPTFTIGASYDIDPSWQMDISWTRMFTGGPLSYMNLYALGLSYHFVDRYCGQFLCAD